MLGRISLMRIRNTKFEKIHTNSYAPKNDFLSYYLCLLSETLISISKKYESGFWIHMVIFM